MQLFYQPDLPNGTLHLNEEESRHAVKVLRLGIGDHLTVTDGHGCFYEVEITEAHHKRCLFKVLDQRQIQPANVYRHIAIAPTKNMDRLEWFVEKAVEFGIDRITPILCHHSERKVIKVDRLQRKAVSAMKQSIKAFVPKIDEMQKFAAVLKSDAVHKYIAFVDSANPELLKDQIKTSGHHLIVIGPEGDFSETEVTNAEEAGFKKVSLGESRLRTETAGVAVAHLLNLQ